MSAESQLCSLQTDPFPGVVEETLPDQPEGILQLTNVARNPFCVPSIKLDDEPKLLKSNEETYTRLVDEKNGLPGVPPDSIDPPYIDKLPLDTMADPEFALLIVQLYICTVAPLNSKSEAILFPASSKAQS